MKVALCFYGQPRFYNEAFKVWTRYIDALDADVFVHTWWGDDMVGELYPCAPHAKSSLSDDSLLVKSDIIDNIKNLYKPKDIEYNSYNHIKNVNNDKAYYQFYTQYRVKELVNKCGIKYDVVIKTRFDLYIGVSIPIYNIEPNTLYTSSTTPYLNKPNDTLSISDLETFNKTSDTLLNLSKWSSQVNGYQHETYLANQIKLHNIQLKTFKATYDTFDIIRDKTVSKTSISPNELFI